MPIRHLSGQTCKQSENHAQFYNFLLYTRGISAAYRIGLIQVNSLSRKLNFVATFQLVADSQTQKHFLLAFKHTVGSKHNSPYWARKKDYRAYNDFFPNYYTTFCVLTSRPLIVFGTLEGLGSFARLVGNTST